MKLTLAQLNKLSRSQRLQLRHKQRYRNCKHNHITWGICDICHDIVDTDAQAEFLRVHPHVS